MTLDDADLQAKLRRLEADLEFTASSPHPDPGSTPTPQRPQPQPAPAERWLDRWRANAVLPLQLLLIPWAQEIIDQVFFGGRWNLPLHPRTLEGIPGVFLSAISHSGFPHLIGNSIGFVIFSWLILAKSRRDYWIVLLLGWLGGGVVSWLLGPTSVHGLSGVVYTLFGYLLFIGWLERRLVPLLISCFVLANYSYFLWGIFPTHPMVAWWGHLFGFLLGILAAYGVYREPHAS
ncbi:rhomboid family intramembrane serine protease [Leptolyngbya sp. BL0902]|uniref:rhomboid family intramembrane serine protease n=1 Tax=Leptolyngbya sp. BL0902 TaxID=1115757 RepID=UPI0018E7C2DC|nr:rhomboid family intramembrane serine protease [Leptolyngbya sp. BL0902]QQE64869.1 rhomboid family intramembrane serine protease [Leptolyngbya sp. BL0902]